MKLIHCADLHLDSPMESNLSAEKARERKAELRSTFARLVRTAKEEGVEAILIAGDMFDSSHITKGTQRYVLDLFLSFPEIRFFYLAGNHDRGIQWLKEQENNLPNLYLFGDGWTSYRIENVTVTGSEAPNADTLLLSAEDVNLLLLHGQEKAGKMTQMADWIDLRAFQKKNIDYLAMGHIHEYRTMRLDNRGVACYSGCLEGRGFDECGVKGYVLLEIENGKISHRFVPFATRSLHTVVCDVTNFTSQLDLEERLLAAVDSIPRRDLVKAFLTGSVSAEARMDTVHLAQLLAQQFYFAKISDETKLLIHPEDYQNDISLKGEFVRCVMASRLSQTEKERVIACGFRALSGEEVEL